MRWNYIFIPHFIGYVITSPCWDFSCWRYIAIRVNIAYVMVCCMTAPSHSPEPMLISHHWGNEAFTRDITMTSQWARWRVSIYQPHDCLPNRLFRRKSKKTSKLRVTGLCTGNSPVTGEFPAQSASNAENVSIWWRHHGKSTTRARAIWKLHFKNHCHISQWSMSTLFNF